MNLSKQTWALLIVGIFAHLMILQQYIFRMWGLAHYQFFPIVLMAAAWLFADRLDEIRRVRSTPQASTRRFLMLAVLLLVFVSTLLNSSFVGWLSLILFLVTLVYAMFGNGVKAAMPVFILLMTITPLPLQLDQDLIIRMQQVASSFASWLLDSLGVLHFQQGIVLVSESNQFLAEEACSGIRSLFSAVSAIIFVGLIYRYPIWRHLINVVQTIVWVLFGNSLRIAIVVMADSSAFPVSTGWRHEMLGLLTFLLILTMAISFDRLIRLIFPFKVSSPRELPSTKKKGQPSQEVELEAGFGWAWVVALFVIGIFGVRLMFLSGSAITGSNFAALDFPVRNDLSTSIGTWTVFDFEHRVRGREDIQGENSFIWSMQRGEQISRVSVDCQWNDFHDLSYCYTGLGWRVKTDHFYPRMGEESMTALNESYTRLILSKPTGERGLVLFRGLDQFGDEVQPPVKMSQNTLIHVREKLINSLRTAIGMSPLESIRMSTFAPPVTTVQLIILPDKPMDDAMLSDMTTLFQQVKNQIRNSSRFGDQAAP